MLIVKEKDLSSATARAAVGNNEDIEVENSMLLGFALVEIAAGFVTRDLNDLAGESFDTVIGRLTFDSSGRASPSPFVLLQWRDGAFDHLAGH